MNKVLIKCPECNGKTQTTEMGKTPDGSIHRQKTCMVCGHKFYTTESVVEADNLFLREFHVSVMRAEKEDNNAGTV